MSQVSAAVFDTIDRPRARALPRPSDRLVLGGSDLQVSPFCIGRVDSPDTIEAAFDAGINFFFLTADMHWPLYEASRRGLERLLARGPKVRSQVVVAVACYPAQPEFCSYPFREVIDSVRGLQRIDLAIAGGAYGHEIGQRLAVYEDHRRKGFSGVRAIGATFHDRRAALDAVREGRLDFVAIRYNPGHPGAAFELFPHLPPIRATLLYNFKSVQGWLAEPRIAALGLSPDFWRPRPVDYYRFALTRPEIDGVLCAPQTPPQVSALVAALEEGPLDADEEQHLMALAALTRGRRVEAGEVIR